MISDEQCIGKLVSLSPTECELQIIFNGARSIKIVPIMIAEPAHIKPPEEVTVDDITYTVEHAIQVGEGGLYPFIEQAKEMYPEILFIQEEYFDQMVEAQQASAAKLITSELIQ